MLRACRAVQSDYIVFRMTSIKIDRLLRLALGFLSVAFVYVIYAAIHERVVVAGDTAPEFTIQADNGRTVTVPNFGGKLLVLNFWATWCPPCVEETPSLSQFAAAYADKGVVVLAVSVDKDEKAYRAFLQKYNPAFLTARDSQIHQDYGTFMYPETYLIDSKGKVLKKIPEPADWMNPQLTAWVDTVLAGGQPNT
jgi:cytochrome c biogenesis protein CcmG, thiol:disulfide interchange protein DsbE